MSSSRSFGETIENLVVAGKPVKAGVFNENEVRAAAGLTMVMGAVAFVYAYFAQVYLPIQVVTLLFFIDFALRVSLGLKYSLVGQLARPLARRQPPHWVSAKPKRFAWSLGVVMSLAMAVITNSGIRGALPLTICMICLALMWLEAVLGLCLGCEIYGFMARRGWVAKDEAFEVCSGNACDLGERP